MKNKVLKAVIVILLIIALTIADFMIVGMELVSYAVGNGADATNHENVKFVAFFKSGSEESTETGYEMNSSEMKLYMKVAVKEEGYFDGVISLNNSNFKLKPEILSDYVSKIEGNTITLNRIRAGNIAIIELGIEPIHEELYGIDMLNKESVLKLTGKYKDSTEVEKSIEAEKKVKLSLLVPAEIQTSLSVQVITNKLYKIGNENKRIVQIQLDSRVVRNLYPIKSTSFELSLPQGIENIQVIAKGTEATNGQLDRELENYVYDKNNNVLKISIENIQNAGKISWKKEAKDSIIATLILQESAQTTEEYMVKSKIEFQGEEGKFEEKQAKYNLMNTTDGIIRAERESNEEIYKGKLYSKEEREYNSVTNVEVNYVDLISESVLEENTTYITENEDKQANIEYKMTTIKKSEVEKVLGQNGALTINSGNKEIKITKDTQEDENGNIVIVHEKSVKELKALISKPEKTGIIRLNHVKIIKPEEYRKTEIDSLKGIKETAKIQYNDVINKNERIIELKDIIAEAGVTVIPKTIYSGQNKQLQMAITLKTDNEKYELFEKPSFIVTMPEGVTVNSISNITISAEEELSILKAEPISETEIIIELSGKQLKYVTSKINAQIFFNLDVNVEKLMPNKVDTIKMQYKNNNKTYVEETDLINIIASNSKLVTHLKVENYNNAGATLEKFSDDTNEVIGRLPMENEETIQVPITYTLINNYNSELTLMGVIIASYTDNEGNEQKLINYGDAEIVLEAGESQVVEKVLSIPAGLYFNEKVKIETYAEYIYAGTTYKLNNDITLETQNKQGLRMLTSVQDKIQVEAFSQLGDGTGLKQADEVYDEQIIKYIIQVTNTSNQTISNLKVKNVQENGNIYDLKEVEVVNWAESGEVIIEHQYDELDTNTKTFEIETLSPGETKELICRVVVKKQKEASVTSANISVSADGMEEQNIKKLSNTVKDAKIKVVNKKARNEEIQMFGNMTMPMLSDLSNLTNEKITNLGAKIFLSEGFSWKDNFTIIALDAQNNELNIIDDIQYNKDENYIKFNVTELQAKQEIKISFSLHIESIPLDKTFSDESIYIEINDVISNDVDINVKQLETNLSIIQSVNVENNYKIKEGEKVIITAEVVNEGIIDTIASIEDDLPLGLVVSKVLLVKKGVTIDKTSETSEKYVYFTTELEKGEKVIIKIEAIVNTALITTNEIKNIIKAMPQSGEIAISNEITLQIESMIDNSDGNIQEPDDSSSGVGVPDYEMPDPELPDEGDPEGGDPEGGDPEGGDPEGGDPEGGDPEGGDPEGGDPEGGEPEGGDPEGGNPEGGDPEDKVTTYDILGHVWVDKNSNNTRDNKEGIKNIIVKIIDLNNQNTFLTDENGKEIEIKTDENGLYIFENIPEGKYNLIFKYDTNTYEIKENVDIKDYIIEETEEKVAITNNIELNSEETIDLELVELTEFDLNIEKYISKVIIHTANETKTSGYSKKQLVREEIATKYISGATVLVEYTIDISNAGELAGYATEIVDYLPEDMKFHSELNTQWFMGEDGNLYNTSLASTLINPGETKTIKLVLDKTMTKDNTGTSSNIAEISESTNSKEYKDIHPSNNQSKAEIIINPATGRVIAYAIAIVSSILIVAVGMYIIKRNVVGKE